MAHIKVTRKGKMTSTQHASTTKANRKSLGKKVLAHLPVPSRAGRPVTLTRQKIVSLSQHMRAGNFAVTAYALEGIAESTFYFWLEQAERAVKEGRTSLYVELLESIKKASAEAESRNVKTAQEGGVGWQANMTWLERRFPDRWGHQSKLSMEEARTFVHRVIGALAMHIADREVLEKIVHEVRGFEIWLREPDEPRRIRLVA